MARENRNERSQARMVDFLLLHVHIRTYCTHLKRCTESTATYKKKYRFAPADAASKYERGDPTWSSAKEKWLR